MHKSIAKRIRYPSYQSERFKRLDILDRMLKGEFYDHLGVDFYTETEGPDGSGKYIPIAERRPSVQTGFASQVANSTSRKLFAGRHVPRITHDNRAYRDWLLKLASRSSLFERMLKAARIGSVGSVAITFRLISGSLVLDVWRPKYCEPSFSPTGDLVKLRVQYISRGAELRAVGFTTDDRGSELDSDDDYWFVREFTSNEEITYLPQEADEAPGVAHDLVESKRIAHNLGFVPGVWIQNLPGDDATDGISTFGAAMSNIVEMDYTLSQMGRGIRYNAAPQLVIVGKMVNNTDSINRGPVTIIHLESAYSNDDQKYGAADAKLLEMVGNGVRAGIEYIALLRKLSFELIAASYKTPETHKGTVSGRAMEILDDSFYDLVYTLRTSYGDSGLVKLLSKIAQACMLTGVMPYKDLGVTEKTATEFGLSWPKMYNATPTDETQIIEGMLMATQGNLVDEDTASRYISSQLDLEDYRVETPPQTEGAVESDAPVPKEDTPKKIEQDKQLV